MDEKNTWGKQNQNQQNEQGGEGGSSRGMDMNSGNSGESGQADRGMERRGMYEAPYSGTQARASDSGDQSDSSGSGETSEVAEDDSMSGRDSRYMERNDMDDEEEML